MSWTIISGELISQGTFSNKKNVETLKITLRNNNYQNIFIAVTKEEIIIRSITALYITYSMLWCPSYKYVFYNVLLYGSMFLAHNPPVPIFLDLVLQYFNVTHFVM